MRNKGKPKIMDADVVPYTKITWTTDFGRFGIEKYSDYMIRLMTRRVYDIAGITDKEVSVFLNGKKIKVNHFMDYSKLYLSDNEDFG